MLRVEQTEKSQVFHDTTSLAFVRAPRSFTLRAVFLSMTSASGNESQLGIELGVRVVTNFDKIYQPKFK